MSGMLIEEHGKVKGKFLREYCVKCGGDAILEYQDRIEDEDLIFKCTQCEEIHEYPCWWFKRKELDELGIVGMEAIEDEEVD